MASNFTGTDFRVPVVSAAYSLEAVVSYKYAVPRALPQLCTKSSSLKVTLPATKDGSTERTGSTVTDRVSATTGSFSALYLQVEKEKSTNKKTNIFHGLSQFSI